MSKSDFFEKSSSDTQSALYRQVGHCIRSLRESRGLSQIHVAETAGLSPRHYQGIEYGKLKCRMDTLEKILRVYGESVLYFFSNYTSRAFSEKGFHGYLEATGDDKCVLIQTDADGLITSITGSQEIRDQIPSSTLIGTTRIWELLSIPSEIEILRLSFEINKARPCPTAWWNARLSTRDNKGVLARICWRRQFDERSKANIFEILVSVS